MIIVLSFSTESDKIKFDYIFNKYKKLMIFKAYEILGDSALAEDAASEAFIRVYKNLHKISDTDSNLTIAFLITIVKNTALTIYRKEKKKPAGSLDDMTINEQSDGFSLEEHVISQMSVDEIYLAVNALSDTYRNVFLLKYAHGMKHSEIADILGLTETNVTVTLHRAKKKLVDIINGREVGKEGRHEKK